MYAIFFFFFLLLYINNIILYFVITLTTVEPHLTVTSLVRSPHHCSHPCSVPYCILQCKLDPCNKVTSPLRSLLPSPAGDRISEVPLYYLYLKWTYNILSKFMIEGGSYTSVFLILLGVSHVVLYRTVYYFHTFTYSGTSPYGHLTSKVTSPLRSPLLSPILYSTVQVRPL